MLPKTDVYTFFHIQELDWKSKNKAIKISICMEFIAAVILLLDTFQINFHFI